MHSVIMPSIIPMVRFGQPKPPGHGTLYNADSDLMHHQYRLSVLRWNPGPTRKNPTQILAACGRFHAVILQEASDHAPRLSDQFIAYKPCHLGQQDTFSSLSHYRGFVKQGHAEWQLLWFVDSCAVLPFLVPPQSLSALVHIHNVATKKRDASTDLLTSTRVPFPLLVM